MAGRTDGLPQEPPPAETKSWSLWRRFRSKQNAPAAPAPPVQDMQELSHEFSHNSEDLRRRSKAVVPGLPRAKTFKRQQSEGREKLEPVQPTPAERRAVSMDRRGLPGRPALSHHQQFPRASAPELIDEVYSPIATTDGMTFSVPQSPVDEKRLMNLTGPPMPLAPSDRHAEKAPPFSQPPTAPPSIADEQSVTTSQYDATIHDELERKWILNLSMHFRDKSKREKFFVTYREKESLWRRVTISLDYRDAMEDSLEGELLLTRYQREKSAKIYEAIRESLQDIQFYETVTNLKLQTTDGRLHVHVVEDTNEIIHYPTTRTVQHLGCRRVREKDVEFDSHMSGFVYKVRVAGRTLIKKEIPGPDTIDEFLYEVNALNSLRFSDSVIEFFGVVVDNDGNVKGLLIDYAERGALIDVIYDSQESQVGELTWSTRLRWARQIVQGLSDIHEAGFVQGDFTLSNIVIDDEDNAKIIDINRRGCPVGWEPPEATPLIDSNQRISMYIGVKSDLYQLGMVLWALAMLEDEPEAHPRPLQLASDLDIPEWYRRMVDNCLSPNPRSRLQATQLLALFPEAYEHYDVVNSQSISVDDGEDFQEYLVEGSGRNLRPLIRTVTPRDQWGYASPGLSEDSYYYPQRGRSPPSPLPSNAGYDVLARAQQDVGWSDHNRAIPAQETDMPDQQLAAEETQLSTRQDDAAVGTGSSLASTEVELLGVNEDSTDAPTPTVYSPVPHGPQLSSVGLQEGFPSAAGDIVPADEPTPTGRLDEPHGLDAGLPEPNYQTPSSRAATEVADDIQVPEVGESSELEAQPDAQPPPTPATADSSDMEAQPEAQPVPTPETAEISEQAATILDETNETHDITEGDDTRDTAATQPETAQETGDQQQQGSQTPPIPSELSGIGSAYDNQGAIRQPSCSDEDLGITASETTTAAPQHVTIQT